MAADKSEELSRRSFLSATIGTAVVATIGCESSDKTPTDSSTGPANTGGSTEVKGQGGTTTAQGGAATGQGGTAAAQGGTAIGQGGTSASQGGTSNSANGGSAQSGGSTSTNPATGVGGTTKTDASTVAKGGRANTTAPNAAGSPTKGGASASGGRSASGGNPAGAGRAANPGGSASGGTSSSSSSSSTTAPLVVLVRGTDWVQATMDAIDMAGGLPDLKGKTVLLKPNIISSDKNATTSVDVIRGVVKAAKAKNATKIIVADAGWGTGSDVIQNMKTLGITDMCNAEGAETLDLRADKHTTRSHANASAFPDGIDFSDSVYNADYVINVPVCKCHSMGKYTMALKAWYGCTENGRPHTNTWVAPAELHLFKQENFVVLDATKAMITGGPSSGTMAQSKIVVASKDSVALDVTGLCVQKYYGGTVISGKGDAWNQPQIKRAMALKFPGWLSSPQAISYAQKGVDEHAEIMALVMA